MLKPSEKFKFSFDWDMNDDTSRDLNPLYQVNQNCLCPCTLPCSIRAVLFLCVFLCLMGGAQDRPDTALLFGRGRRAGIDLREQQQQNA